MKCSLYHLFASLTHHNAIGHEKHQPTEDMNHKEGDGQPAQVIILTAAKDIPMTCDRAQGSQNTYDSFSNSHPYIMHFIHIFTSSLVFFQLHFGGPGPLLVLHS